MASTTQENDNEHDTGLTTVGGARLVITTTPTGMYRIVAKGVGGIKPKITEETYTSLHHAKRAVAEWYNLIAPKVATRRIQLEAIERRKTENGEG